MKALHVATNKPGLRLGLVALCQNWQYNPAYYGKDLGLWNVLNLAKQWDAECTDLVLCVKVCLHLLCTECTDKRR